MKIKDIVMREDGTGTLTTKPLPGAQQIIAPDGKAIGTADQATADAMKAAAEKGTLTLGGDEQQTSEEHEEHDDLVSQGNHDIGGDGTDQFIHDITMHHNSSTDMDEAPTDTLSAPGISSADVAQAQAGFGGADPTSKQGVDNFLAQDDTVTPEEKEQIKKMMAWEPDGTLDVHGTLQTVSKMMPQVFEDLCQMMDDMADAFEKAKNDPGIKDLPPEQIKQIDDTIAACREAATKSRAQLPALNKSVSDIQSMPKPTAGPTVREAAKRADDELLEKMRMIAGLR
jgi:hypothetical protein